MQIFKKKTVLSRFAVLAVTFLAMAVLQSCDGQYNDANCEKTYEVKVIDSCEYIYVSRRPWSGEFSLTHKGNCKFCTVRGLQRVY